MTELARIFLSLSGAWFASLRFSSSGDQPLTLTRVSRSASVEFTKRISSQKSRRVEEASSGTSSTRNFPLLSLNSLIFSSMRALTSGWRSFSSRTSSSASEKTRSAIFVRSTVPSSARISSPHHCRRVDFVSSRSMSLCATASASRVFAPRSANMRVTVLLPEPIPPRMPSIMWNSAICPSPGLHA